MRNSKLFCIITVILVLFIFNSIYAANQKNEFYGIKTYNQTINALKTLNVDDISLKAEAYKLKALSVLNNVYNSNEILSKEKLLSILLNIAGKEKDATLKAQKLESIRTSGNKLVTPYNALYLGYIQVAFDMKVLSKKEYQEALQQVKPSKQEHEKMTNDLIKKNEDTILKAVYDGRPYSYDDLIYVRSAPATRQEACYYIVSIFNIKPDLSSDIAYTYPDYSDIDIKFLPYINTLLKLGALVGKADGKLHPQDSITFSELLLIFEDIDDIILQGKKIKSLSATVEKIQYDKNKTTYFLEDTTGNQASILVQPKTDIVVYNNGVLSTSKEIKVNNEITIYYNTNNQILFTTIDGNVNLSKGYGVFDSFDTKKNTITIIDKEDRTLSFAFNDNTKIIDNLTNKTISINELKKGDIVDYTANKNLLKQLNIINSSQFSGLQREKGKITKIKNNSIDISTENGIKTYKISQDADFIDKLDYTKPLTINDFYEGQDVIVGLFGGYVHMLSSSFQSTEGEYVAGILSEIDNNLNYIEIWDENGQKKVFRTSKKIGLTVIKNDIRSDINALNQGDPVFLYFNQGFVNLITSKDNQASEIAQVVSIVRDKNNKKPIKALFKINNKVTPQIDISNVRYISSSIEVNYDKLKEGQIVKINGTFFGNFIYPSSIEITEQNKIFNIYYGNISKNGDRLFLSNYGLVRTNTLEKVYTTKNISISPSVIYIVDGAITDVKNINNKKAIVVTQKIFDQELVALINVSSQPFDLTIGEISSFNKDKIIIKGKELNLKNTTYSILEDYLIKTNVNTDDKVMVVSLGKDIALIKYYSFEEQGLLLRGTIEDIKELEWFRLKTYSTFDKDNGWVFSNIPIVLQYDTQTLFTDFAGINDIKDFKDYKGKNIYVLTDGKKANTIINADFGGYIVSATFGRENILENPQYYEPFIQAWYKFDAQKTLDDTNAIYIKNGNLTYQKPEYGDNLILLIPKQNWDISNSKITPVIVIINN
ncbi:S-layer homology domain-containing protein [Caldicellulosiruptoraceae bacterium PP1]